MLGYIVSWIVDFLLIAIIAGALDELTFNKIEKHQNIAAFMLFIVPTLLEMSSYYFWGKPFLNALLP